MAYVTPNSTIKLLRNVPLMPDHSNTLWFPDASTQNTFFNTYLAYSFTAQTYQRVNRGVFRCEMNADYLYNVNYMMFQNTSYGTRWFYAFVTSVEYVNDATTEIQFVIDDLQTWLFDYETPACFVERMHAATDTIGSNIVPETLDTGEYIFNGGFAAIKDYTDSVIILMFSDLSNQGGAFYDGVYGACTLYVYHNTVAGKSALETFIQQNAPQFSAVMGIYMLPKALLPQSMQVSFTDGDNIVSSWGVTPEVINSVPALAGTETLDGYTPKNKKLYTYPYNFLHVTNMQEGTLELRYEFFHNLQPVFIVGGNLSAPVGAILFPKAYKNSDYGTTGMTDYSESISLSNFPMCSYAIDSYVAWLSQNLVPSVIRMVGGAGNSAMSGNAAGAGKGLLADATELLAQGYEASISGDIVKGNLYNGSTMFANGLMMFAYARASIKAEYARMIDDYFTAFGYAQKKVMTPNPHVRKTFTYIKTVGCVVKAKTDTSGLPADAMNAIAKMYDAGIRFWDYTKAASFGNLAADNTLSS